MARRRRRQLSPEFKAEEVRLVASSNAPLATIAQQLGLARLRRENLQLKMERDILKTATAFFARQSE